MGRPGFAAQASVLHPEHVQHEDVLNVLVRLWEYDIDHRSDTERLPGPPHLTIEDYHVLDGHLTGLKLVTIEGPCWLER